MKIARSFKGFKAKLQKGFTLIELAIVGLFLGLLAVFAISQFSGSATDSTRANGLYEAAQKIGDNWALIAQQCGTANDVTAITVGSGAGTTPQAKNLSMLVGTASAEASYVACVNQSGVRPLAGISTGSAGFEKVQGYTATLGTTTVNGRTALTIQFAGVPDNVLLPLYSKYSSVSGASNAASITATTTDVADPIVRFSAQTSGVRNVTLVRSL